MQKNKQSQYGWVWLSVLLLFVCVAASAFALMGRLNKYQFDDSGAISLLSASAGTNEPSFGAAPAATPSAGTQEEPTPTETPQSSQTQSRPGFQVSDEQTVWTTDTQVEIFRVSYENGEQAVTVHSDDGDKLIAPGTENSYTFKLKNTGNVAIDYTVTVDAYCTPADIAIPVTARLNRYDGAWIVGGQDSYADVSALDAAEDAATLGAGKYTYYTLDWLWPFESGDDAYDTMLGDLAEDQDMTFAIVIKTVATASDDPGADSGITPPKTGDENSLALWIALAAGSVLVIIFLLVYMKKEEKRSKTEAPKH